MRISADGLPYLNGEKFSNGYRIGFDYDEQDRLYRSRIDVLSELCADRQVIHLGCVDHDVKQIRKKLKRNKWLHKRLCDVSERCLGIDISEDGIRYLREKLGFDDVSVIDITAGKDSTITSQPWDYLLIPEVLEHIDNPVAFLSAIRDNYRDHIRQVVITVPNAFSRDINRLARKGFEGINTDHRYWFTPYTLSKVVTQAGISIDNIIMCKGGIVKKRSFIRNRYFRKHPLLRGNIVLLGQFRP
jgi:hypothetical protein